MVLKGPESGRGVHNTTGSDHRDQGEGGGRSLRIRSTLQVEELLEKVTFKPTPIRVEIAEDGGREERRAPGGGKSREKAGGWSGTLGARGRGACHPVEPGERARKVGRAGHSSRGPRRLCLIDPLNVDPEHPGALPLRSRIPAGAEKRGTRRGLNSQTPRLANPAVSTAKPGRRARSDPSCSRRSGGTLSRPSTPAPGPPLYRKSRLSGDAPSGRAPQLAERPLPGMGPAP